MRLKYRPAARHLLLLFAARSVATLLCGVPRYRQWARKRQYDIMRAPVANVARKMTSRDGSPA